MGGTPTSGAKNLVKNTWAQLRVIRKAWNRTQKTDKKWRLQKKTRFYTSKQVWGQAVFSSKSTKLSFEHCVARRAPLWHHSRMAIRISKNERRRKKHIFSHILRAELEAPLLGWLYKNTENLKSFYKFPQNKCLIVVARRDDAKRVQIKNAIKKSLLINEDQNCGP